MFNQLFKVQLMFTDHEGQSVCDSARFITIPRIGETIVTTLHPIPLRVVEVMHFAQDCDGEARVALSLVNT